MDEATLLWGLLYGSIGLGYFIYGKKQKKKVPLACGIALMVFPYAVTDVWVLAVAGVVLMTIPIVIRQ
ncbi:MAG: hypothetical protein O2868_00730 [Proteobacteria bacterium]|nr:hypothetical protein [Pseudomonadota bacterium]